MILFPIYFPFSFLLIHVHTAVLSLVSLVCTKKAWLFSYYIINICVIFHAKFSEAVSMERLS